jgi:hypothetical protein
MRLLNLFSAFLSKRFISGLFVVIAGGAVLCGAQTVKLADAPPELRDALLRDAQCPAAGAASGAPSNEADRTGLLQTHFNTQTLHGAGGTVVGVIAMPAEGCHCQKENCTAWVYVKSPRGFRLALRQVFESLRPMKAWKRGMPSITGRYKVSETVYTTSVRDWDGSEYQPTMCATVTQGRDPLRPSVVRRDCPKQ